MGSAVGRRGNERLVKLRRHLLNWAVHTLLLLLLLLLLLIVLLSEGSIILELRRGKGGWCAWLERGAEKELRREQWSELHVEARSRSLHVVLSLLVQRLGVD